MKKLYLVRHAKSDWSHSWESDFERGINERGVKSIQIISSFLHDKKVIPDLVISSPAKRAKLTSEWVVKKLSYKKKDIVYLDSIYEAHMDWYDGALSCVMEQDSSVDNLFFIWHNYAISELASFLAGRDIWSMKTCSVICLKFGIENWSEVSYWNWEIVFYESPKSITK